MKGKEKKMKKLLVLMCILAMGLTGCNKSNSGKQKLVISTWGLNADIIRKKMFMKNLKKQTTVRLL